jgi:ankyrin repeat protein
MSSRSWSVNKEFCNVVGKGQMAKVTEMLDKDPTCSNCTDEFGWYALHIAASLNKVAICKLLLHRGADYNCLDSQGETPLDLAFTRGYIDICKELIQAGAQVKNKDLPKCSRSGDTDICELLLHLGVPVDFVTESGTTALHGACEYGNVDTIRLLLSHNADLTIKNKYNETCFDCAGSNNKGKRAIVLKV